MREKYEENRRKLIAEAEYEEMERIVAEMNKYLFAVEDRYKKDPKLFEKDEYTREKYLYTAYAKSAILDVMDRRLDLSQNRVFAYVDTFVPDSIKKKSKPDLLSHSYDLYGV